MNKKILALLISALLLPQIALGQINTYQGGTGLDNVPAGAILVGDTAFSLTSTTSPTVGYITATSTTATSTFPNISLTTAVNFLGDYVTNSATWIRSKISETIAGISYNSSTGVFSLSADYEIPLTASTTHWEDAYGWGNHADGGYLTSYTETDPIWVASSTNYYTKTEADGNYDPLGQATSTLTSHTSTYNHANYDTAYSWGDHSGEGYLTALTPWTSNIDGGGYNLTNVDYITATGTSATSTFTALSIGTTTHAYALNVEGSIQTDSTFYGNTWSSYDGNSMNIKPSGDEDDFLSFKTIANRPTTKIEGGPFHFWESSSNVFTGISMRKDDTHSGSIIYYKLEDQFGLSSKDPLVFKVCGDYDDYVKICAADNIPELSVASSSGFKINAGGTNALLLNHDGGNVGIGTTSPAYPLDVYGNARVDGTLTVSTPLTDVNVSDTLTVTGYMQDTDIDTFAELQSWAVGYTDNDTTYVSSDFTHDDLTGFVANEHLDWTQDLGATNIHSGNYTTLTNLTDFDQTAWRLFYSNNLGDVIELSLGTNGEYLQSQGGTASLTWSTPTDTTANETITLSGDITGSGETAITTTIGANKILESMLKSVNEPTDEYVLTYEATTGDFEWQSVAGGGDITQVFDCSTGDCNTMTVGTSEYLTYGTGYIDANRFAGVTTVDGTEFGYLNGVTSGIQTQFDAKSASFSTLAALNVLIGETVASTTHVWDNAYIASSTEFLVDNNTTYTGGDFLTLTATDFDVDATTTISNGDTTHLASADTIYDWGVGLFQTILTNSAGLLAALDDETGTGVAVFNTSPTLVTPALGTPSALVGTNITGTGASFTAGSATALAGNGANCSAGSYPLGVNASGAVESCTDATTEINSVANGLGGTNLSCSGQSCSVDDAFVLHAGDTYTGVHNLGGATSIEIPNAAAPVTDTAGEISLDTTDNQLLVADSGGTARVIPLEQKIFSVTVASTSVAFVSGGVLPIPPNKDGFSLTKFKCYVKDGTSVVINVSDGTNDTETITCATTLTSDEDVATNDTFTAGELAELQFGTVTGTPNYLSFTAYGHITRE